MSQRSYASTSSAKTRSGGFFSSGGSSTSSSYSGSGSSVSGGSILGSLSSGLLMTIGMMLFGAWIIFFISGYAVLINSDMSTDANGNPTGRLRCVYVSATGGFVREYNLSGGLGGLGKCRKSFRK